MRQPMLARPQPLPTGELVAQRCIATGESRSLDVFDVLLVAEVDDAACRIRSDAGELERPELDGPPCYEMVQFRQARGAKSLSRIAPCRARVVRDCLDICRLVTDVVRRYGG